MNASGRLLLVPLLVSIGCGGEPPCDCAWADSGLSDVESRDAQLRFSPNVAAAGEVFITSMTTANSTEAFDYARVEELVFYGEVTVCTMQARSDELLVSLGISSSASSREVDLVVVMDDGETLFVEAALTILGGDGSSGDGTADGALCAD